MVDTSYYKQRNSIMTVSYAYFLKRIHSKKVLIFTTLTAFYLLAAACHRLETPPNWPETLKLARLDHQLLRNGGGKAIMAEDSAFGVLWTRLLHYEGNDNFDAYLNAFAADSTMQALQDTIERTFPIGKEPKQQLADAFAWLHTNMPSIDIPRVYFINGGFNAPCMMDTGRLGVALECFLGPECSYYEKLQIPLYLRRAMRPERIAPAALIGWTEGMYPPVGDMRTVLDHMLYQGKLLYIAHQALPKLPEHIALGFSKEDIHWLEANEGNMWRYLSEKNVLFESNPLIINQFTGPAPFTRAFGNDSPGRAAAWLGYRIVASYFKANPSAPMERTYFSTDSQQLLAKAKYNPK